MYILFKVYINHYCGVLYGIKPNKHCIVMLFFAESLKYRLKHVVDINLFICYTIKCWKLIVLLIYSLLPICCAVYV